RCSGAAGRGWRIAAAGSPHDRARFGVAATDAAGAARPALSSAGLRQYGRPVARRGRRAQWTDLERDAGLRPALRVRSGASARSRSERAAAARGCATAGTVIDLSGTRSEGADATAAAGRTHLAVAAAGRAWLADPWPRERSGCSAGNAAP